MRRRGYGAGALLKQKLENEKYKEKANELATQQLEMLSKQLEAFHSNLEEFAAKHKQEIKKNPEFRNHFQKMCATIGVDPLASSKGFWSEMLGVGTFYYELGIQAIEVCISTRVINGGIISMKELHSRLLKTRGKYGQDISTEDIKIAINKLKRLGTGIEIHGVGDNQIIQSVPGELNMDHTMVLELAQKNKGHIRISELVSRLSWKRERCQCVIDHLLREGMAWIDSQTADDEDSFWFPAFFLEEKK